MSHRVIGPKDAINNYWKKLLQLPVSLCFRHGDANHQTTQLNTLPIEALNPANSHTHMPKRNPMPVIVDLTAAYGFLHGLVCILK